MELQLLNNNGDVFITLKEITDLLDVRHDKAMKKVDELLQQPDFGTVEKMDIVYNDKGQVIETYLLNKKQAIIVAARLNIKMFMLVVTRIFKLEEENRLLTIENAKQQTEIIELKLQETEKVFTQQLLAKDIEKDEAVKEAKKLKTHNGLISVMKYVKENNKSVSKDVVWDALIHAGYVHNIVRTTQYRRLNDSLDTTEAATIHNTKSPVFSIELMDRVVVEYLASLR